MHVVSSVSQQIILTDRPISKQWGTGAAVIYVTSIIYPRNGNDGLDCHVYHGPIAASFRPDVTSANLRDLSRAISKTHLSSIAKYTCARMRFSSSCLNLLALEEEIVRKLSPAIIQASPEEIRGNLVIATTLVLLYNSSALIDTRSTVFDTAKRHRHLRLSIEAVQYSDMQFR